MKSTGGNEALEVQNQSATMTTSDNGGQQEDVLSGGTRSERIRETFEKTLLLMDPVADVLMKTINNEEKLRLYGLYKHIRKGPCNDVAPSIWNIEEYYKHQSHNSRRDMHVDDAMREYVDAVVEITTNHSFMNELAASCKRMLKQVDEAPVGDSSSAPVQSRQVIAALPPPRPSWSAQLSSTLSSIPRGAGKAISSATGVRPLIPRGQLDISYNDLAYGAVQCAMTGKHSLRPIEQKISKQWIDATSNSARIVTGLAVRSLFDLYLRVQKYPPGSEIIMSPPINVPSMVHVMKHHGIKIVGVDIPGRNSSENNGQTVSVDVEGIEKAITPKTVAIMVVHPFGIISASHDEMKRIRKIADSQKQTVHILEDCAEVFVGLTSSFAYTGSTFSDISFFSFGLIKAATALGGGIALIRDAGKHDESSDDVPKNAVLYESMQRFHNLHYEVQSNSQFFSKVMKALFLRSVADMPLLYALLYTIVTILFGPKSFDDIVTSLIRGYFNYKNVHDSDKAKSKSQEAASPDIGLIRKRPAPALLALLHRRFTQVQVTKNIAKKVERCNKVTKAILKRKDNDYEIPVASNGLTHYYWIYPILSSNRQATTQHFIKAGFDATHGATQLCCIPGTEDNSYPNARDVMDRTVYLPIAGPQFPDEATNNIIRSIEQLPTSSALTTKPSRRPTSSAKIVAKVMPAVVITTVASTWFFDISLVVVFEFIQSMTVLLSVTAATIVALLWFFRNSSAPIYMDGSHAFSKYSDMLLPRENKSKELVAHDEQRPSIMSSMEVLKVRDRLTLSKNGDQSVFLTGASGFVGSKILHDLLLNREKLRIGRIIVLCRAKRNVSGNDRIIQMLDDEMFSFLTDEEKTECVEVVEGDVTLENAGISNSDLDTLCNHRIISHVIHCAASVSFNQSLPDAAKSNITSTLSLQKLATKFNRGQTRAKTQFVHISTAFVHGGSSGSESEPLPETLFDLGKFDPQEIYKSMVGTQYYASKAYNELGFPNTYTFSKCICEHLLVHFNENMSTLIIRPSIVGPAVEAPYEGWAGKIPTTVVATAALYFSYQWNLWCFGEQRGPVIPVDVLSRYVLVKSFNEYDDDSAKSEESSDDDYDKISKDLSPDVSSKDSPDESVCQNCIIHNATWDSESPLSTTFIWREYAMAVLHVGGVMGNFSRAKGLIGLFFTSKLFPRLNLKLETFERIHRVFVQFPFSIGVKVCGLLGHDTSRMKRLQTFLDLPVLFYSFINNTYYFKSELIAPKTLSGERYAFSCVLAAHSFIMKLQEHGKVIDQAKKPNNVSNYQVAGPWANQDRSLFWAWTQPRGNFIVRAAGWVLAKVFSSCCSEVTVDLTSFTQVIEVIKGSGSHKRIILAPTHRSFFDFLLVSYVFFCVPELQVDVPFIVAADDFERLPFLGTLARLLRAVFISRDKTNVDPKLKEKLNAVEKRSEGTELYVEVFIEGTRSRDRRFARPKTGVLKCLQQNGGGSLIVPIAISYERLPDQSGLCAEADGGLSKGLQASGLVSWLYDVFCGKIDLGKIHLTACAPLEISESRQVNFSLLVDEIQMRQQSRVYVSNYHIECTAKLLGMQSSEVRTAFAVLGVPAWPHDEEDCVPPPLPESQSELLTVVLQASPFLAPLFHYSHPSWSKWLNRLASRKNVSTKSDPTVTALAAKLSKLFDDADLCVDLCHSELLANGFTKPSHQHLLGTAKRMSKGIPNILLSASISIKYPEIALAVSKQSDVAPVRIVRKTKVSDEALGFWGFYDSAFVLRVDRYGKPYVTMEGSRYGFEGKKITKLIPFIEAETELKMDPTNEAFRNAGPRVCSDCKLSEHDISLLKGIVTSVSLMEEERLRHGTGHCQEDIFAIREGKPIRVPDAVVWPDNEEEVEKLVKLAKERNWCLFPYGGGTNVSQATRCPSLEVEPRQIISVDMRKMNRIVSIDEENGLAHIEAGITGRVLEEQLRIQGYTMGHEPDSMEFSTLGGWIATKASGMKRSKYGNIEDIVMSVRVASARGVLQHGKGSGAWGREACGIDLRGLIIGSEGCLGIITSAVVRISPVAGAKSYDSVLLPDFDAGYEFMHGISRQKTKLPSSVRLLDNEHFRLGLALKPDDSSFLTAMKKTALGLFLKLTGRDFQPKRVVCATISYEGSKEEVREQMEAVSKLAAMHGGVRLGAEVGKAGYSLTFMIAYLRDFAMTYHVLGESFETFVPWSKVKDVIRLTKERIRNEHASRYLPGKPFIGARITQLYHEGACLYFYFCMNFENVDNASHVYSEIEHAAREEILAHGGSLSHHHGLGKVRASYLKDIDSPPLLEAMKSVKQGIDPDNTFGARNGAFASDE